MAEFAYSTDGGMGIVKDYLASASYSAAIAKKGEFVDLDASGFPRKASGTTTLITGIVEAIEFTGLVAQGQPHAATNASRTAQASGAANGVLKVRLGKEVVYRLPRGNATATHIGLAVGLDANHAVATAAVGKPLRIVDVNVEEGFAFVTLI